MEASLLDSEILGRCGLFWSQLSVEIEEFHLHLVTTTWRYCILEWKTRVLDGGTKYGKVHLERVEKGNGLG